MIINGVGYVQLKQDIKTAQQTHIKTNTTPSQAPLPHHPALLRRQIRRPQHRLPNPLRRSNHLLDLASRRQHQRFLRFHVLLWNHQRSVPMPHPDCCR
jgi:hypothetical protein